jgi:hypothetical protein
MKTLIIFLIITFISYSLYSQSSIVYDAGTIIDIGSGSDVCADTIIINGTQTGVGTFCNAPVTVESDSISIPDKFELSQNYPNPFNPSTIIRYQLPMAGHISLKVYDVLGNEVATLVNEDKPTGSYKVEFDASNLSSGIYFYKIQAENFIETKKMLLLK